MRGRLYLCCFALMALGVLIGRHASGAVIVSLLSSCAVLCLCLTFSGRRAIKTVGFPTMFLAAGIILMFAGVWSSKNGMLPELAARKASASISGRIVSPLTVTGESTSFLLKASFITVGGKESACGERVQLRIDEALDDASFYPGLSVEARGRLLPSVRNAEWLLDRGAACVLQVSRGRLEPAGLPPDPVSRFVHASRNWFSKAYRRLFTPEVAGLMEGVALSKLDGIDPLVLDNLRACGLSHIVAVSGLHVGSIAMLTLGMLAALGAGRNTRYVTAAFLAAIVLSLSNFRPSAVRACLMASMSFTGTLLGREYDSLAGLSIAGILIIVANPRSLLDMGFQYSFAAALGIVLAVRNRREASGARLFLAVCASAQLGVLPVMLLRGEGVPVTALVANFLVVSAVGPLLISGWVIAVLSGVSRSLAGALAIIPAGTARYTMTVASTLARVPRAGIFGTMAAVAALLTYLAALVWLVKGVRVGGSLFRPAVACLVSILLALVPCTPIAAISSANRLTVLDVGEGDATLIQDRSGAAVLIDGGPNARVLLEKLEARGVRKIDVIVSTHPHVDHITGLVEVMKRYRVGRLVDPGLPATSPAYRMLLELAERRNVPRTVAREGQVISVSRFTTLDVLYAPLDLTVVPEDVNDCSIVVMARVAGMRALMSGDIGCEGQEFLLGTHPELTCDLLKVPHQGAREASSSELLYACRPALAAISVGRNNSYGHPSRECLELLAARCIRLARTDRDGDIELSVDNDRIGLKKGRR